MNLKKLFTLPTIAASALVVGALESRIPSNHQTEIVANESVMESAKEINSLEWVELTISSEKVINLRSKENTSEEPIPAEFDYNASSEEEDFETYIFDFGGQETTIQLTDEGEYTIENDDFTIINSEDIDLIVAGDQALYNGKEVEPTDLGQMIVEDLNIYDAEIAEQTMDEFSRGLEEKYGKEESANIGLEHEEIEEDKELVFASRSSTTTKKTINQGFIPTNLVKLITNAILLSSSIYIGAKEIAAFASAAKYGFMMLSVPRLVAKAAAILTIGIIAAYYI